MKHTNELAILQERVEKEIQLLNTELERSSSPGDDDWFETCTQGRTLERVIAWIKQIQQVGMTND